MPRKPVESSLIRAVGYDAPSSILEVELADSGLVYDYFDVPFSAYHELMEADSKGAYYNDFIKDLYAFKRRNPQAEPPVPSDGIGAATIGMPAERPRASGQIGEAVALITHRPPSSAVRPRRPIALEREIAVFRAGLPGFLGEHEGQFVLIRGEEIVGFWPTFDEALEAGMDRFGPVVPLLVKEVTAVEPIVYYSRDL